MWNWKIMPSLAITNALRLDRLSLGREGVQPVGSPLINANWNNHSMLEKSFNSALVWQANDVNTFRIMAARGIQVPSLIDLGGLILPVQPFGFASGIPSLYPTSVANYEVGWDRKLSLIEAQTRVSVFHEISHDLISSQGGSLFPTSLISIPTNIGSSQATGLELSIKGIFFQNWRWGASYTPETIHDHFSYTLQQILTDYQDTMPVNVVNANLGWSRGPWEIDSYLRYESNFFSIRSNSLNGGSTILVPIKHYTSVDGRIAYKLTKEITVALSAQNIQGVQQQTSAPNIERRVLGTVTIKLS
jgi:outer membrane receptor for ferrienterochelin and colicins